MKLLYLTPSHLDYLSDQLYTGLCKTLGWESVVDFPYKAHYHSQACHAPFLQQTPGHRYELDKVLAMLERHEFDLVVLSALRREAIEALEVLRQRSKLPPLVLVDGDDGVQIRRDLYRLYDCGLYFKREYQSYSGTGIREKYRRWNLFRGDQDLLTRTYALPFSVVLDGIPKLEIQARDVDISFVGLASNRQRVQVVEILRGATDVKFEGGVYAEPTTRKSKLALGSMGIMRAKLQGDPYASEAECRTKLTSTEYFQLLSRSKIGLSVRGAGFDTLRYWEIVASKALLLSERPSIDIPDNFEHGKHAVFCRSDFSDLLDLVREYVSDQSARSAIAEEGYRHLLRFHTCERRAERFLEICRKRL